MPFSLAKAKPPICTPGYAAALSKGNRDFALRDCRSYKGASNTGASARRRLETTGTMRENWACDANVSADRKRGPEVTAPMGRNEVDQTTEIGTDR